MLRYGVAAIVGCLYVAGAVWLVGSRGESYRESLHPERLASATAEPPVPDPSPEEIDDWTSRRPSAGPRPGQETTAVNILPLRNVLLVATIKEDISRSFFPGESPWRSRYPRPWPACPWPRPS